MYRRGRGYGRGWGRPMGGWGRPMRMRPMWGWGWRRPVWGWGFRRGGCCGLYALMFGAIALLSVGFVFHLL